MSSWWNWVGARWWKFDFHCHTPGSDDYGKGPNQTQEKQISPKEWLLNYMRSGVDCIAVTDHNTGAWIDRLKQALVELEKERHSEYRPLYLFPGVEITVQGNVHLLAIFPSDKSTSDIDTLLGTTKYYATKGASDGCTVHSAVEVVDEITRLGGLAIPAHVDENNGLFSVCSGSTLEQILSHKDIVAMEIIDGSQPKPQMYIDKKLNWSGVLGTDSHHPIGTAGQRYPGSHFTWVKMSEPSFDGLRLALIDGDLSLKRSDQYAADPNVHGQLVIESISVNEAKYLGCGSVFTCCLNPWLNTIIGGRGTGKSTVLEFLRAVMGRNDELPPGMHEEFLKYRQTSVRRQDEGLLRDKTSVAVCFRKDECRFRMTWSNDGTHRIEEETTPGEWLETEGDISLRFPIRIYSQKQIFELAKDPQSLLRVVDDAPEICYREWKTEWDELVSRYLSIRAQEREVIASLQDEAVIRGQLRDVKRTLGVFEKAEHANVLRSYQLRQNQGKAIEAWEQTWGGVAERVRVLATTVVPPELDATQFTLDEGESHELLETVNDIRSAFLAVQLELNQVAVRVDEICRLWKDAKPGLTISRRIQQANQEYASLISELSEVGDCDPSGYGRLVKQQQDLEEKLKGFDKKRETLAEHRRISDECLQKIHNHRSRVTKLRRAFLEDTLAGNSYVQINVVPYGNKATIEDELRDMIDRRNGGFDRDIGSLESDEGLLSMLYRDATQPMDVRIEGLKAAIIGIHENNSDAVAMARDKRFISHIQGLKPEQIDRMRCWFPDDTLDVRYSLKDGETFRPVEQGSPGQKTAALLAFFLSYGHEPLILDQPEDDLDNNLIYGLIVTQLREIKQRRQVLIVTHNANIVVNGDAENVIALDIRAGQTRISSQGSLQDSSIRKEICRVMEGGEVAFDQRYRRINAGR